MRELSTCLKVNFLSKKVPTLMGIVLLFILYIKASYEGKNTVLVNYRSSICLFLIIYAAYNYKNSFTYWISIGGTRRIFYISNFIFSIFIAVAILSIQIFISIGQSEALTPIQLWSYHFFELISCIFIGSFLGVLSIKCDLGFSIAITMVYFNAPINILKLLVFNILGVNLTQFEKDLFQIILLGVSLYIGWAIIKKKELGDGS